MNPNECPGGKQAGGHKPITQRQLDGEMDSSEVENHLHLGCVDRYGNLINSARPFAKGEDGDKYKVAADHIPPRSSFSIAGGRDGFDSLKGTNPGLHDLVRSLNKKGTKLLSVQVPAYLHNIVLSSGSSKESIECRERIAEYIFKGDVRTMLKLALIIAHPEASQLIRIEAGFKERSLHEDMYLSDSRILAIYKHSYRELIDEYHEIKVIDDEDRTDLLKYVEDDMYLDRKSELYQEIVEIVRHHSKGDNKN